MKLKTRNWIMNRAGVRQLTNARGMTLIEIMIVIAIIGGLMAVLGTTAFNKLKQSRVDNAKIQIRQLSDALNSYNMACNSYPTTEQGLDALTVSPGAEACSNWGPDPYVKGSMLKDPWGKPFIYESDGGTFNIISLGSDKKEGGDGYDKDLSSQELDK
jgi:general secretion pathway protein G